MTQTEEQQSSNMVGRIALAIREKMPITLWDAREAVSIVLEASHHAELVEALLQARKKLGWSFHPDAVAAREALDEALAKIGGAS